jgi:transposase
VRHDKPARRVLKSSRWLLLRNRRHLNPQQSIHLKELLAANEPLTCVYVLRDTLKQTLVLPTPCLGRKGMAPMVCTHPTKRHCRFAAVRSAASGLPHGILSRCRHPLNTSIVEGINNTIKVIKRRAYGYRDEEYFFLKIRAAFPGKAR